MELHSCIHRECFSGTKPGTRNLGVILAGSNERRLNAAREMAKHNALCVLVVVETAKWGGFQGEMEETRGAGWEDVTRGEIVTYLLLNMLCWDWVVICLLCLYLDSHCQEFSKKSQYDFKAIRLKYMNVKCKLGTFTGQVNVSMES